MTYSTPGTYTYIVPTGYVANITVQAWGGGGGGASDANANGGGGGGGYVINTYTNVPATVPASTGYTIVVGAGGAINAAGGLSSYTFTGGTVTANGGATGLNSGNGGAGGSITGTTGVGSIAGGNGANRTNPNGIGGGGGGSGPGATNASGTTGGSPSGGTGGAATAASANGASPGGGGGGKSNGGGTVSGTGGAGQVIVTVNSSPLPVVLISFSAAMQQEVTKLSWQTSAELNNDKFIIETSTEGEVFNRIGEIDGAGSTTETHDYTFTHHTPSAGVNYYRLKQVDFDGTFEYSKVLAINAPGSKDVFAFPNPAKDKITVQYDYSKGAGNIQLYDALGRRINASIAGYAGNYEVKLPDGLAKGTYWLKVERGGQVQTVPVVKE